MSVLAHSSGQGAASIPGELVVASAAYRIERQVQGVLHDPANGRWGDCMRTCLAMMLGMDRDAVPHHNRELNAGEQDQLFRDWLGARGMGLMAFGYAASVDYVAEAMRVWNPGSPYILSGKSPRGTQHVVVVTPDGRMLDPHPDDSGLVGPDSDGIWWVYAVTASPTGRTRTAANADAVGTETQSVGVHP